MTEDPKQEHRHRQDLKNHYWYTTMILDSLFGAADQEKLLLEFIEEFKDLEGSKNIESIQAAFKLRLKDFVQRMHDDSVLLDSMANTIDRQKQVGYKKLQCNQCHYMPTKFNINNSSLRAGDPCPQQHYRLLCGDGILEEYTK